MKLLAVVPYTGSEALVAMTESMLREFAECLEAVSPEVEVHTIAVNNNAVRGIDMRGDLIHDLSCDRNYGFGVGVNRAIDYWLYGEQQKFDHLLVLNNDLQFPDRSWLAHLLREVEEQPYILAPRTDVTATHEACHEGPEDKPAQRLAQVSAYCWLVPFRMVKACIERFDWPLFPPEFTNYGSDDAAAAVFRKLYGPTPFKVVHRSWVKHLKARTANELGVKAGTKELLTALRKFKKANRLK